MSRPRKKILIFKGHAEIPLKKGLVAIIDLIDVEKCSEYGWILDDTKPNKYVHAASKPIDGKRVTIKLHRFILGAQKGQIVDHIDGNGLNNARDNLRLCTAQQNSANSKKSKRNSSKYKGVHKRENGNWRASIRVNQKLINIGTFKDETEAAKAYNESAQQYFGEFACLNKLQ